MPKKKEALKVYHRFLDESGDTTFYGKKKKIIVGTEGVSKSFILGMVKFRTKSNPEKPITTHVVFNVMEQTDEPLLNVADYFCWSIQNVFEKVNIRYYNYLKEKISTVIDLYDFDSYGKAGWQNYYGKSNLLTIKNKLSPLSH